MILEPLKIRRPFDPTGESKDNYVHGETHKLPVQARRIIVPRMGAFYARSLVVRKGTDTLQLGRDYELAALYHDATVTVGQDVNVLIVFTNDHIVDEIEIDYQVVGGEYTGTFEMIQQYVNTLLVDPRKVRWDDILAKPDFYAPREHFHDINDVYGINDVVPVLEEIRQALIHIRSREFRQVYDRIIALKGQYEVDFADVLKKLKAMEGITGNAGTNFNEIRASLRDVFAQIALKASNTDLTDKYNELLAAVRLKANQTELNTKYDELNNKHNALQGNVNQKADQTDLQAKYDELLAKLATKANQTDLMSKYNDLLANINNFFTADKKLKNLHIPISSTAGNQVELKNDGLFVKPITIENDLNNLVHVHNNGLYVGPYPPPHLVETFVDAVNGSDTTGNGTRANPYKTINKAIAIAHGYRRTIKIMEGQDHLIQDALDLNNDRLIIEPYGPRFDALPENLWDRKAATEDVYHLGTSISFRSRITWSIHLFNSLFNGAGENTVIIHGVKIKKYDHALTGQPGKQMASYVGIDDYHANVDFEFRYCGIEFMGNNPNNVMFTGTGGFVKSRMINLVNMVEISGTGRLFDHFNCPNFMVTMYGLVWDREGGRYLRQYMPNLTRIGDTIVGVNLISASNNIWFPMTANQTTGNHFSMYCNPQDNARGLYADAPGLNSATFSFTPNDIEFVRLDKKFKATEVVQTSDIRLKEDIHLINNPIEKIKQLHGYTFRFKNNEKTSGGVIAQEVEQVLPEIVDTDIETGMKSVSYNGIVGLLIETVNQQQKQIDVLTNTVKHLQKNK
nr:MAG TPA: structural protein [Caudoviricetes sp.]